MECAQCGAQVPAGRKSCAVCGTPAARMESAATPQGVEAMLAEANLFRARGQFDEAISACMRILQLDATHAAAHSLIADIYRDQGNYREALNWFKLAVELDPDNEADKRKLDEMIDRVFQGVLAGEMRASVKAIAQPPPPSAKQMPVRRSLNIKAILAGLQPTYVAVALALVLVATFSLLTWKLWSPRERANGELKPATSARTRGDSASNGEGVNARATAENLEPVTPPVVTPPAPDAVENGDMQPKPVPGLPGIVINPNPGNLASPPKPMAGETPASNTPPAQDNNAESSATSTPQVPPFNPLSIAGSEKDKLALLKITLEYAMKSSKLVGTLNEVTLDPDSNILSVNYTVPRMQTPTETRQGLLYIGFHLIWAAAEQNTTLSRFSLLGNAYSNIEQKTSLALAADITPEQAETARAAADYKSVLQYLNKAWWRADMAAAAL